MKKTARIIFLLISLIASRANAANTFSASAASGTGAVMGDPAVVIPFVITNGAGSTNDIKTLFFNIPTTNYNISAATAAPTACAVAWNVQNPASCLLPGCIEFQRVSGGGLAPGASCTFDIVLTGVGGALIPAASMDATDALANTSIVASKNATSTQSANFTLTGSPPSWPRNALAATMTAVPDSVGTGDAISVSMGVTNRSSAAQSGVIASPDPPARTYTGGANATQSGAAIYGSTTATTNPAPAALSNSLTASMTIVQAASTAGFPASGRLLIDAELVDYTGKTATAFTGCARAAGGTTAAGHFAGALIYSQNTSSFTLASGESSTITWLFNAAAAGTVYFTSSATNVTATSKNVNSNIAAIGAFTAQLSMTPLSLVSGQNVTVTMTAANNGTTALTNVTPTLGALGTAMLTPASGPTPSSIADIAPGASGAFQWTYAVTGTPGQTYSFTGYAASGASNTNTAASATGTLVQYGVAVSPSTVATGAAGGAFTWTVSNRGGADIKTVAITIPPPLTSACGVTKGWGYSSNTPPANWTATTTGAPVTSVTFNSNTPYATNGIPVGGSKSFTITFNCVPAVTSDAAYNFAAAVTDTANAATTINSYITVTAYQLTIAAYDEDCAGVAPASKTADGASAYCLKASLSAGGIPVSGKAIDFAITSGAGMLDVASTVTDSSGSAAVKLTAPCSTAGVNTMVRATLSGSPGLYGDLGSSLVFTGVSGGSLQYLSGSFKKTDGTSPDISTGYAGGFILNVRNCGNGALTLNAANTTLTDRVGNGFTLASGATLNAGASAQLSFIGAVSAGPSNCAPTLTADAGAGYTGAFSYYKSPAGNSISASDTLIVDSGAYCPEVVKVLDWRELR
ncbi:MAG: hypothetical protein HY894_01375 [Deltaproteobacteria bacterium]|nr:hypothetical protein [Deltaproteobacteria bacterium]